jgi:hypothetical protein
LYSILVGSEYSSTYKALEIRGYSFYITNRFTDRVGG